MSHSTLLRGIDMWEIYGTDWCAVCTTIKKELTARSVAYDFITLPAGPRGWEIAEELSGRRALPVIMRNKEVVDFAEFKAEVNKYPREELTQEQLDRIEP
jgi:glutaredoxin